MKLLAIMFALDTFALSLYAQPDSTWGRTFGDSYVDEFTDGLQTPDGEFVFGGWSEFAGTGVADFWLVKTNQNGNALWNRTFGGIRGDRCLSIALTTEGGVIMGGGSASIGAGDIDAWIVRTNVNGDSLWSRKFGGDLFDQCEAATQTADGGYACAGGTLSFGAGYYDFWLLKTDVNGDSIWSRTYGGSEEEYCTDMIQSADGGFALAGWTTSFGNGDFDFWLVKTDENGDSLWSRTFGGVTMDQCWSLQETADGGYVLAGTTMSFGAGSGDLWLVKTDANGAELWNRTYGGYGWDACTDAHQTFDGGYILTGTTFSFADHDSGNGYLVKTDDLGDTLWAREFGGLNFDYGMDVLELTEGYLASGSTASFGVRNFDGWLVKFTNAVNTPELPLPVPSALVLSAFPNPFNSSTSISLRVAQPAHTTITVFDIAGREVEQLYNGGIERGEHTFTFSGMNLTTGLYFARVQSGDFTGIQKLLLLK